MVGMKSRSRSVEQIAVTVRIAGVDVVIPAAVAPDDGTIEIACRTEGAPLPVEQDVTQVAVAAVPVAAIDVVAGDT